MWVLRGAGTIIGFWAIFKLGGLGIRWCREGFRRLEPDYVRAKKEEKMIYDDWGDL